MALEVEFDSQQKVLVTDVTAGGTFFLQLDTPVAYGLPELSEKIRTQVEAAPESLHPEARLKCYALSVQDNAWYRALVTAVSGTQVEVYYVDYGNVETVPASNLNCPSGDLFSLPYQAVCCVLGDFTPQGGQWSPNAARGLREAIADREFAAIFRSRNSSQKHPVFPSLPCLNVTLFADSSAERSIAQDLVGQGLGQYCICAENVAVDSTAKMFTCYVDSPGMFWLQLSDKLSAINAITDRLNSDETHASLKPLPATSLFPSAACCAVFSEDKSLYRCEVIRVGSGKVDVRYVDYGNSDTVDVSSVLEIPAELARTPAFAIQCCLDGVKPRKPKDRRVQPGAWSMDACDKFSGLSEGRELEVEFVSEITPEVFSVRLRDVTSGENIGHLLAKEDYAELPEPVGQVKKNAVPQIQYGELKTGQRYKVIVTHLESPGVVWCQRTEYSLEFDHLMTALAEKHASFPPLRRPTVGQVCCQQYYLDESWCRGRVESVDQTSGTARVLFLDYGNTESVKLVDIRELSLEHLSLPAQAVRTSMSGIQPAGQGKWTQDAIDAFSDLVLEKGLLCRVVGSDQDGYPAVQLADPNSGNMDIGNELVRKGLAHVVQTPSPAHKEPVTSSPGRSYQQQRPAAARGSPSTSVSSGSPRRERSSRENSLMSSQRSQSERSSPFRSPRGATPSQPSPSYADTAKQPSYTFLKFKKAQSVDVIVTHISSPTSFFCQFQDRAEELTALMEEISSHCSSPNARPVVSPAPKLPVLALYSFDECWYRAVVESLRPSGDECTVNFVDYGDSETLPLKRMQWIPFRFLNLPAQALSCCLYNLPSDYSSTPEANEALMDLVLEKCVQALARAPPRNEGKWKVDLVTPEGVNVLDELVKLGHIPKTKSPQSPVHKSALSRSSSVPLPIIPVGSPVDVVVSYFKSPTCFYVQLMENYTTLERIASGLQGVYQNLSNRTKSLVKPEVGALCAAQFSEDKAWYRSRIASIVGSKAMVYYLDYGNSEEVDIGTLKALQTEFTADPCGAIPCVLAGLPADGVSDDLTRQFEELELHRPRKLVAEFSKPLTSIDEPIPVRLTDTTRPGTDLDITKSLLKKADQSQKAVQPPMVSIPTVKPQLNALSECLVTHVVSPAEFYCQLWSEADPHDKLTDEMYTYYGTKQRGSKVTKPSVGTHCVALFSDGSWYRAVITGLPRGGVAEVTYIDYGNKGEVEMQDLRVIETKFSTQQAQAVRCQLAGVVPTSGKWSEESCTLFNQIIVDQSVDVTFLADRGDAGYEAKVKLSGEDIAEVLIETGMAQTRTIKSKKASQPSGTPKATSRLTIPAYDLEAGQECDVVVTASSSPTEFYCQVLDKQLDKLMEEIEEYCTGAPPTSSTPHWSLGDAVLGQFTEDEGWYRATIVGVRDGGKLFEVRYVDYGNVEALPPNRLKAITSAFCQLPAFVVPCSLHGADQLDVAAGGEATFNQLILDKEFHLRCIARSKTSQCYNVELREKEKAVDVLTVATNQGIFQPKVAPMPSPPVSRPQPKQVAAIQDVSFEISMVFPELVDGTSYTVSVVHCESPKLFYCHFTSKDSATQLEALMAKLQDTYSSGQDFKPRQDQLSPGTFAVAQFSEDELWYRARVANVTGDDIEVMYVDYGNQETLPQAKVHSIAEEFTCLPAQAVPCSLLGVTPLVGSDWSAESTEAFMKIVMEETLVARINSPGETSGRPYCFGDGKTLPLSLSFTSTGEGNVAPELIRQGFAKDAATTKAKPSSAAEVGTAGKLSVIPLAPGSREEAYMSHSENPSRFWVQLATSDEPLGSLAEAMATVYNSSKAAELKHPKVGDTCSAKFSEDQNWYRGIIKSCDNGSYLVHFVDYGNSERVNAQDLKSLEPQFFKLPAQAIVCSLTDCSPVGGAKWTDEAATGFSSLIVNLALDAEFLTCNSEGVWEVKFHNKDRNIAAQLVDMGFARSSQQETATATAQGLSSGGQPVASELVKVPELTMVDGESYPMYMTHVVDPSEFYCQLATSSPILDDLMARVADYYTEHRPQVTVETGRYCVAQYSGNNAWYRARVLRVALPNVTVYFVDYGNSEVVSTDKILALQPQFASLPSQAVSMALHPELVARIPTEQFFQLDLEQEFQVTVISVVNSKHIVSIQGDEATSQLLQSAGSSVPPSAAPPERTPEACSPLVYPLGATVDVYVSYVNSPSSFYCQPLDLAEELDEMMTQLVDLVAASPPRQLQEPSLRQTCLAKYKADGEWYRARITSFPNKSEACVTFFDYGNSETTSVRDLYIAPRAVLSTRAQAIHCSVFEDVEPDWTWAEGKVSAFTSRVMQDNHFTLTILGQGEDDRYMVELSDDGPAIDFSHLLEGEEGLVHQTPLEIPSNHLPTTAFQPIPPDEASSLHPSAEVSLVAVHGSKSPSTDVETESENGGEEGEGEGEPLIKAPYMMGLSRQEVFEAAVVHVQGPSLLYLQKVDCQPLLDSLSEEIGQYCASFAGASFQHSFRMGDLVLAKYSLDKAWYRAKVVEVHEDGSADVSFIDYGNMDTVNPRDMNMCPESFLDLPAQAIPCSLAHVPRREEEWPEGYKELIDKLVERRVMRATVVVPGSQGMRPTIVLEDMESGTDVSSQVLAKLQEECETGASEGGYAIGESPSGEGGSPQTDDLAGNNIKTEEEASADKEPEQQPAQRPILFTRAFEVESSHEVYLVSCHSPHSFVCQLSGDEEAIDSITTHLAQLYGEVGGSNHPLRSPPVTGDIVCAQFTEDEQWYRAQVVGVYQEQCEVVYLDFGNSESVPLTSVCELDTSLAVHPPMAVECFLYGVECPEKVGHFDDAAASKVTEMIGEEVATIEILSIDTAGHLGVLLRDSKGTDVGAELIGANFASRLVRTPQVTPSTTTLSKEGSDITEVTPTDPRVEEPSVVAPVSVGDESPIPVPKAAQTNSIPDVLNPDNPVCDRDKPAPIPDRPDFIPGEPAPSDGRIKQEPEAREGGYAVGEIPSGEGGFDDLAGNNIKTEEEASADKEPEQQPAQRPILPTRTFEVESSHKVYLVSCHSPHLFVCQLSGDEETIDSITTHLAQLYGEVGGSNHPLSSPPVAGDIVCAQFTEDEQWYRAQVVGVSQEQCEVVYLDFGNSESVPLTSVCELDTSLAVHPPMAVECFLYGVECPEKVGHFDEAATSKVTEMIGEEVATIEILSIDTAGHLGVLLRDSEGTDVGAELIGANFASRLVPTPQVTPSTTTLSKEGSDLTEVTPTGPRVEEPSVGAPVSVVDESPIPVPKAAQTNSIDFFNPDNSVCDPDKTAPIPDRPDSIPGKPTPSDGRNKQEPEATPSTAITSYPDPLTLPTGTREPALIVSVTSPDHFIGQLIRNTDVVLSLLDEIAAEGYEVGDGHLEVKAPKPDLPVCACFTEDNRWYRAQIVSVDLDSNTVTVKYVDYGNSESVTLDRVKCLQHQFADPLPPQAIICSLPVIREQDLIPDAGNTGQLEWPPGCTQHFTEMTLNKDGLYLEILDTLTDGRNVVRVLDVSGEQEVDIRERLVAELRGPKSPTDTSDEDDNFHDALETEVEPEAKDQAASERSEQQEVDKVEDSEVGEFEEASQFIDQTEQGEDKPSGEPEEDLLPKGGKSVEDVAETEGSKREGEDGISPLPEHEPLDTEPPTEHTPTETGSDGHIVPPESLGSDLSLRSSSDKSLPSPPTEPTEDVPSAPVETVEESRQEVGEDPQELVVPKMEQSQEKEGEEEGEMEEEEQKGEEQDTEEIAQEEEEGQKGEELEEECEKAKKEEEEKGDSVEKDNLAEPVSPRPGVSLVPPSDSNLPSSPTTDTPLTTELEDRPLTVELPQHPETQGEDDAEHSRNEEEEEFQEVLQVDEVLAEIGAYQERTTPPVCRTEPSTEQLLPEGEGADSSVTEGETVTLQQGGGESPLAEGEERGVREEDSFEVLSPSEAYVGQHPLAGPNTGEDTAPTEPGVMDGEADGMKLAEGEAESVEGETVELDLPASETLAEVSMAKVATHDDDKAAVLGTGSKGVV